MTTLREKLKTLPAGRRKAIEQRAAVLIGEEMTMRELRKARKMTQAELAKTLGVNQEQVSRLEKRSDLHLSTLRRSIEAMGGTLSLIAEFPGIGPVTLKGVTNLDG